MSHEQKTLIEKIKENQKNILLGEIAALLHDLGKCDPRFICSKSKESPDKKEIYIYSVTSDGHSSTKMKEKSVEINCENFDHSYISEIIQNAEDLLDNEKCKIFFRKTIDKKEESSNNLKTINENDENIISIFRLITEHHPEESSSYKKHPLLKLFRRCDQLDSSSDKGNARRKQLIDNTVISSPFSYPKEIVNLAKMKKDLEELAKDITKIFNEYINKNISVIDLRKNIIKAIKIPFTHALGETREPANDVTLWDHSFSMASLFKSALCRVAIEEKITEPDNLQFYLLGFCWNGIAFINKGKKISDILERKKIVEKIKSKIKNKFENEIPVGNAVYEDINGIYFTFPALQEKEKIELLAQECSKEGLNIILKKSKAEIFPFFTLGEQPRQLTALVEHLNFASKMFEIPKINPHLFILQKNGLEKKRINLNENLDLDEQFKQKNTENHDICSYCQYHIKSKEEEMCKNCSDRIKGRLVEWKKERFKHKTNEEEKYDRAIDTIWIDEVADINNRIAIITLSFDLQNWFNGTMIQTLFSQSLLDWVESSEKELYSEYKKLVEPNVNSVIRVADEIIKAEVSGKEDVWKLLDILLPLKVTPRNYSTHLTNIKKRIGTRTYNGPNFATILFTKNPSPARISRVWKETEDFFNIIEREIKENIYKNTKNFVIFKEKTLNDKLVGNKNYLIKVKNLKPENLLVFYDSDGYFSTIESLEKFTYKDKSEKDKSRKEKRGIEAIEEALRGDIFWLADENTLEKNLFDSLEHKEQKISIVETKVGEYIPLIKIIQSPLTFRFIVPAIDSMKIIQLIVKLYNQRFEKVLGKLPLNVGLLVSNRKFPLYVLLDSCERMFSESSFKEPKPMNPWWDTSKCSEDDFYSYYPTKIKDDISIEDLSKISQGKVFDLYPGYFDFDILQGTTDRYNITYDEQGRIEENYKLFSNRPYFFYQINEIIELWDILSNNLSSSQITFIENTLSSKIKEWRYVEKKDKDLTKRKFVEATLKDAFSKKWEQLREETQTFLINSALNNLLLDTIVLYKHIIKEKVNEEKKEEIK